MAPRPAPTNTRSRAQAKPKNLTKATLAIPGKFETWIDPSIICGIENMTASGAAGVAIRTNQGFTVCVFPADDMPLGDYVPLIKRTLGLP